MTEQENKIIHAFVEPEDRWRTERELDYCDSIPFDKFLRVLFGQEKMHLSFENWAWEEARKDDAYDTFSPYLFHPAHHDRFLRLFLDFLSLEGTQREWGWEEGIITTMATWDDDWGDGKVRVPRPWLRALKEGKK